MKTRLLLFSFLALAPQIATAGDPAAAAPKLYGLCVDSSDGRNRSLGEEAQLLRDLGYDGGGYQLWLGKTLDNHLRLLDDTGLPVYLLWTSLDVRQRPDVRVLDAIRSVKGRPVTISVLLTGLPPGDPRGMEPAVRLLRKLGDAGAAAGVRISIYHHVGTWTESLPFTLEVVRATNHPQVGFNFNLCHWLKVSGRDDYRPLLRDNAAKLFAVTINGATVGAATWTNGLIRPLDEGDFDNRQLLATLNEIGYRGPVGLMCLGVPGDAREHLTRSMVAWRKLNEPPAKAN